jgi:hypothetical protein
MLSWSQHEWAYYSFLGNFSSQNVLFDNSQDICEIETSGDYWKKLL